MSPGAVILWVLPVVAAAACVVRARRLDGAIRGVAASLASMRGGNLDARIDAPRRGPVAVLAREVSDMAEELRAAREDRLHREERLIRALEAARGTLEEKVKERTAELTRAYNELKSLDAMKDSFISSVSHELRTPLSSIRAFSEILLSYAEEDQETRREFLQIINKESERLTRLVEEVLDLSKIESGKVEMVSVAISLPDLIRHAREAVGVLAREAGLQVRMDLPEGLPPVLGDPDRVAQVMTNLLANAVKFTPPGGEVLVSARAIEGPSPGGAAGLVEVRVADSGIGIPQNEIESVFEKFKQVGSTLTGKPRGTGLGLPISREIIQRLGGRIWAECRPGAGATFAFTLPAALDGRASASVRASRAPDVPSPSQQSLALDLPDAPGAPQWTPSAPGEGSRRPTVAVADDDGGLVEVVTESLRVRGFNVLQARDGSQALVLARERPLDLLILDLQMPKMSGWQVLDSLRADPRTAGLPVIVLTGWAAEGDRIRALSLGAVEYLMKGQGLSRLCAEIEMATRGLPLEAMTATSPPSTTPLRETP